MDHCQRFSFELFPPRNDAAAAKLTATLEALLPLRPEFVSVTFGAGGSTSKHSLGVLQQVLDAGISPMAHLTCVGLSVEEAGVLVRQFLDAGISKFLALRGDLPHDGSASKNGLGSAAELVQLIHRVESERVPYSEVPLPGLRASALTPRSKRADIAVAAFPNGHPGSGIHRSDVDALLAKQAAGATLAITQLFFDPIDYVRFVELATARGVTIPIIPGVIIPTTLRRLVRSAELAGERVPSVLAQRLEHASREEGIRIGVDAAVAQLGALEDFGVPGIHLYTFNDHRPAIDVLTGIGAVPTIGAKR